MNIHFEKATPHHIDILFKTLEAFVDFYHHRVDLLADTFFIDPDTKNPRAEHVYRKAGFMHVGEYHPTAGAFVGSVSSLMVKYWL